MRLLSLLVWVTQFGISSLLPLCLSLILGNWLQTAYGLGLWITALCGVFGLGVSIRTACACLRLLRRDIETAGSGEENTVAFNDHE